MNTAKCKRNRKVTSDSDLKKLTSELESNSEIYKRYLKVSLKFVVNK